MIAVTGANGYVGGRVLAQLRDQGIETVALVRTPALGDERERRYALAQPLDASALEGVDTVVHAAYDLAAWGADVRTVNCAGSLPLLDALAERGGRAILISSLAAFAGARSHYGQAKLALERAVLSRGGAVVRPGLVFGMGAGGLFGALVQAVSREPVTPLVGGGWQRLFITHDRSLCRLVAAIATGQAESDRPIFAAHAVPTTLRAIAAEIARAHGRRLLVVPVPTAIAYAGLRALERAGLRGPFRADSVRSISNPIPLDQVAALARLAVDFPPLRRELWLGDDGLN